MTPAEVVIYVAQNSQQAHLLKAALSEHGIKAEVTNETLQGAVGSLPFGYDTACRVTVRASDGQRARQLALEFERDLRNRLTAASGSREWFQFSIYALLVLTTCVAIYLGIRRVLPEPLRVLLPTVTMWTLLSIAMWRALRRRKIERLQADESDDA